MPLTSQHSPVWSQTSHACRSSTGTGSGSAFSGGCAADVCEQQLGINQGRPGARTLGKRVFEVGRTGTGHSVDFLFSRISWRHGDSGSTPVRSRAGRPELGGHGAWSLGLRAFWDGMLMCSGLSWDGSVSVPDAKLAPALRVPPYGEPVCRAVLRESSEREPDAPPDPPSCVSLQPWFCAAGW